MNIGGSALMKPKALSILLALLLFAGGLFAFLTAETELPAQARRAEVVPPQSRDAAPTSRLLSLVERVEALEQATSAYYHTENTFDHVVRYIRHGRYGDLTWKALVGAPDPAYVLAMSAYSDLQVVEDFAFLQGNGYTYTVDFVHLCAAADAKLDFAGWAGDLITLAAGIGSSREAHLLLAAEEGSFNLADYHADIDARNLYALSLANGGSLSRAMRSYYLEGGINTAVTDFLSRELNTTPNALTPMAVYDYFYSLLSGETAQEQTLFLEDVYGILQDKRLRYAAQAFSKELFYGFCGENHGHQPVSLGTVPPTCRERGYTQMLCRCCQNTWYTDPTPVVSHEYQVLYIPPVEGYPGLRVEYCKICGLCGTEPA